MNIKRTNIFHTAISLRPNKFTTNLLLLLKTIGFEAAVWITGLAYLAFIHIPGDTHFTICPIKNLGFDFCPGCGLGNSISYIFRGDIYNSFLTHPLGLFALVVLSYRIIYLIKNNWSRYGKHISTNALP
ncbi:hypothetical protein BMS3Abin03_02555 [bacterium BMS3Abin03]|nr:hypothetical protein BMS3Abin03_02555 [bacterium BMS3Abin03]